MAVAIALADDSVIVREGVAHVLAAQPGIEVVVSCGDLPSLLEAVASERPDVVVTDIRMPPTSTDEGIRAAVLLREQHPDIGVVVLSNYAEPRRGDGTAGVRIEGRAYLLKKRIHDRAQLVAAIESVAAGGSVVDSKIVERSSPYAGTSNAAGRAVGASAAASAARRAGRGGAPAAAAGLRRKAAPGHSVLAPGARPDDAERPT